MPQLFPLLWFKMFLLFVIVLVMFISVLNCFMYFILESESKGIIVKSYFWNW